MPREFAILSVLRERRPQQVFPIKQDLQRLLAREKPEYVLGFTPTPIITAEDLGTDNTINKDERRVNPRKKRIVNILNAAACTTINVVMTDCPVNVALPSESEVVTDTLLHHLRRRVTYAFGQIKGIAQELHNDPIQGSNIEIAHAALRGYFVDPQGVRKAIFENVISEIASVQLFSEYFSLLKSIYERDNQKFPNLSSTLLFGNFSDLGKNSLGLLFSLAKGTKGNMHARLSQTVGQSGQLNFDVNDYELAEMQDISGHFYVRKTTEAKKKDDSLSRRIYRRGRFRVAQTGCPAMVHIPDLIVDEDEQPTRNLIATIVTKALQQI